MVAASSSPTARRWELAARLRKLRLDAGVSVEEAAAELLCSPAKISRMETAGRGVQPRDVRDLARFYKIPDAVRDQLMTLAAEARKPGWWQDFRTVDEQAATLIGLEGAAVKARWFEAMRVPGLLQTADFTQALLPHVRPPGELTEVWISESVAIRGLRRRRLESGELTLHAIIDEAALHRPVGGAAVMSAQMGRLLADAARPNVSIQVIPFAQGPHPGVDGAFELLAFPPGLLNEVVHVEGLLGNFMIDRQSEVERYSRVFEDLAGRHSLSPEETISWLKASANRWLSATRTQRRARSG